MRKDWNTYWMDMAFMASTRSTCPRRNVGAVIVKDNQLIATGYNGSPKGHKHCEDIGCDLNEQGRCERTIHAEMNAVLLAGSEAVKGALLYTTDYPCVNCARILAQVKPREVFYAYPFHSADFPKAKGLLFPRQAIQLPIPEWARAYRQTQRESRGLLAQQ